jgi:hypothetical protein
MPPGAGPGVSESCTPLACPSNLAHEIQTIYSRVLLEAKVTIPGGHEENVPMSPSISLVK